MYEICCIAYCLLSRYITIEVYEDNLSIRSRNEYQIQIYQEWFQENKNFYHYHYLKIFSFQLLFLLQLFLIYILMNVPSSYYITDWVLNVTFIGGLYMQSKRRSVTLSKHLVSLLRNIMRFLGFCLLTWFIYYYRYTRFEHS